ncbi:MAG: nucleotide sugar dehydrogenase [Actinomycetota bacterium]
MSDTKVAVVGLGKIGLPLAVRYALSGLNVTGCDLSKERVDAINDGRNPIAEEAGLDEAVGRCVSEGRLRATTETSIAVKEADVVVVIVPLIALDEGGLDYRSLDAANEAVAAGLHPGVLVVYETTLPVGTTRRFADVLAARAGLTLGSELLVAFSPERVYSGRILRDLEAYPKIVGGVDASSGARAVDFYREALPGVPIEEVPDAETAELVKLAETTYRDVNIAFANELARYATQRGIDIDPVIRLANTQPFSHIHQPGAGVGGHCIPHYPRFILADGADAPLIRLAREINDRQPAWLSEQLADALGGLDGRSVLVLGVSYREDVKELTSSPGVDLIRLLAASGARVSANDPYFSDDEIRSLGAVPVGLDRIGEFDAVVVQAAHHEYQAIDWSGLRRGAVVFDGRNALDPARIVANGAAYRGVGRATRSAE